MSETADQTPQPPRRALTGDCVRTEGRGVRMGGRGQSQTPGQGEKKRAGAALAHSGGLWHRDLVGGGGSARA